MAASLLRAGLAGLAAVYGFGLKVNWCFYEKNLLAIERLPCSVISVGNLTTGGTGKTSAVQMIARRLTDQGKQVAILSRGYGGRARSAGDLVSDGHRILLPAQQAGDEPFLMASRLPGVMVLVGKDRGRTGRRAVEELGAEVIVLDDGFQYRRLHKDLEIVLIDALNPFGFGHLLPRGLLREPVSNLRRAHAIWLTHADLVSPQEKEQILDRLARIRPDLDVAETRHRPVGLRDLASDRDLSLEVVAGKRLAALSGIGNPASFELTLAKLGAQEVIPVRFPDHYRYRADEMQRLESELEGKIDAVVTTEKDEVRLPSQTFRLPVWVLQVEMRFVGREPTWLGQNQQP